MEKTEFFNYWGGGVYTPSHTPTSMTPDPVKRKFLLILIIVEILFSTKIEKIINKKLTTLGIPRRSPIQVLTEPDVA